MQSTVLVYLNTRHTRHTSLCWVCIQTFTLFFLKRHLTAKLGHQRPRSTSDQHGKRYIVGVVVSGSVQFHLATMPLQG